MITSYFKLSAHSTSLRQETIAGLTTFFTLAYIVIVAPHILESAGMNLHAAFISTCLIAGLGSILSGMIGNYPIALAPGLGLLSYFSFVVVGQLHYTWQQALGMVLISGVLFLIVTLTRIRQWILAAIPHSLGCCIASGIGVFIGLIALRNVGLIVGDPNTLLAMGPIAKPAILLFFLGFCIVAFLDNKKVPGGMLIGIVVTAIIGFILKISHFDGIVALPTHGTQNLWAFNITSLLHQSVIPVIFTFFIVALFDSTGTLIGLTQQFPAMDRQKGIQRTLIAESLAIILAAILGTSTAAAMVENASGIRAGGKTGLTAVIAGIGFLLLLFFAPLAMSIPNYATAAILFYVACMMMKPMADIDWKTPNEFIPAVITLIMIPLTYSISNGIGLGILCYVILNSVSGQWKKIHPMLWLVAVVFLVYFLL